MKKLILLLLTIISGLSASSANTIIEYDGISYSISSKPADGLPGTVSVEKSSRYYNAVIPDTIDYDGKQYIVESIGGRAFQYSSISSIRLPNTLKFIGYEAFNYCNRLTSVVIPDSVIQISAYAFSYCSSLSSVEIGKSVSWIESAFYGCSALKEFIIDEDNPNLICIDDIVYSKDMSSVNMCLPSKKGEIALPESEINT